jgi:adenylate cyclase
MERFMRTRSGPAAMLEKDRVEVVAIFGDLRNFTAFSADADPRDVMSLLGEYYAAVGSIIDAYGATLTNFAGDGLMMLLNAPSPCPDPAIRAVRMAVEMQAVVQRLARSWRSRAREIGYGMGIAKGFATVGRIGYENRRDYTAIGHAVNLASRLCSSAEDGQILVDAVVAREVAHVFPLDNLGCRPLKGLGEHVPVHAIAVRAPLAYPIRRRYGAPHPAA